MRELIDRQQAVDALRDYLVEKRCPDDGTLTCRLIENEVINKLQPIQPEIVRCKDCQDYQTDWSPSGKTGRHYCATMDSFMLPDGFCSYAERREVRE